mmetsp:Transcript_10006/g.15166  ORF Transcript_10006/g.15166 Transcript_10006/m.15166 type:complete len:83 (+) Transcript_10006:1547-1795(+)
MADAVSKSRSYVSHIIKRTKSQQKSTSSRQAPSIFKSFRSKQVVTDDQQSVKTAEIISKINEINQVNEVLQQADNPSAMQTA